jgi:hypothetical protein
MSATTAVTPLRRRRPHRAAVMAIAAATLGMTCESCPAMADEPSHDIPVAFGADQLRFDAHAQALDASGHVHVEQPPFHLMSSELTLRRVPMGVELEGPGTVAFCPCLGTPLAVRFRTATIAPPHDLILRDPVLEVFGVPIAWAPSFWLRSPGRAGLLAPDVSWRGADGLFLGGGVHLPWRDGDLERGVDLRAGAYLDGGVAIQSAMRTSVSETRVAWDEWRGQAGIGLQLHGATAIASDLRPDSVAWNVDALRGGRAVRATTDLDAAALPFDRAEGQTSWRGDGWTFASGLRSDGPRGGSLSDLGVGGPVVVARRSGAIGDVGAYDATTEGGAVVGGRLQTTSFARAEGGVLLATHVGSAGAALAMRTFGDVLDDGSRSGVDGAAQVRLGIGLPLEREFASRDEDDPWSHRTEPRLEAAAIAAHANHVFVFPPGRGMNAPIGAAWAASAGWYNAIGRVGSRASAELDASGGAVGDDQRGLPVVRARGAASGEWLALQADFARVFPTLGAAGAGGALVARVRVGEARGFDVSAHIAERDGIDPLVARAIVDAPLEPASGFLAATGWTGGTGVGVPIGPRITTKASADFDFESRRLVAALAALELHDPCNCVVVRANAAHRIGRDGIDVWLSVDLPRP